ncbi:hypothetical protein FVF58_32325 [Paraburkholderia panacisoli]|uniref:PXPV repeat-containing protein n=1 Tax=Paraburkholderia panacisoli TaxID=2603818 RepID=A0A5B0GN85_9BURK|nr:hypothetical protein [Paraburkholderia panacisoli]KAA1004305.1 hypothetical protein FVF58_32325 [Paraburkholderia panacisoli]
MKIPAVRAACTGSMKTRIMTAVGLALAIGGMSIAPAFGEGNGNQEGQQQHDANNNYQHKQGHPQQHGMDNGSRQNQGHQSDHGNRQAYQHPNNDHRRGDDYGNQDYVYAPPPVVYAPESAPGISLFIPLQFR